MKKLLVFVLILAAVLSCVGCNNDNDSKKKIDTFTIEELEEALRSKEMDIDEFKITQKGDGYTFTSMLDMDLLISGTADENKMVTSVTFKNMDLDGDIFESKATLNKWLSDMENFSSYQSSMTLNQLGEFSKKSQKVLHCIYELQSIYSLTEGDSEDGYEFAINALVAKGSSDIKDWNISVTVSDMLVIEAKYSDN